jgi:hypothetical protein
MALPRSSLDGHFLFSLKENLKEETNMKQDFNGIEFFNDKALWRRWFVRDDLSETFKQQCREWIDLDLFNQNWKVYRGVTLEWDYAREYLPEEVSFDPIEGGRYRTVFLHFQDSFLEAGKEDTPEHYRIRVYHKETKKTFAIPHQAVMSYYRAGWPRDGWDPRMFTELPWRYLEPIHRYLKGETSHEVMLSSIPKNRHVQPLKVITFIQDSMLPFLFRGEPEGPSKASWRNELKKLYDNAVTMNQTELMTQFQNRNPYTGVYLDNVSIDFLQRSSHSNNAFWLTLLTLLRETDTRFAKTDI